MKCDKLTAYKGDVTIPVYGTIADAEVYLKEDVDAAIAELKQKLEDVQASMYCDVVDANMENRRLKSALWIARAERARTEQCYENYSFYIHRHQKTMYGGTYRPYIAWLEKWDEVERKCRAKAEVYLKKEADEAIAELKDKCQMHDFFWEGCGFAKRGFKNSIAVSEAFDKLEAENRRLKRALYKACANWAHFAVAFFSPYTIKNKWYKMERKCRAKAEEYK